MVYFYFVPGLYQKNGTANRDESLLLSLYNASKWKHETASSISFNNERTNLVLSGLTQTKHVIKLLQNEEKN